MRKQQSNWILIFIFLCGVNLIFAANPKQQGLPPYYETQLKNKSELEKITYLLDQTKHLQFQNTSLAIILTEHSLQLAIEEQRPFEEAKSRFWKSSLKLNQRVYANNLELLYADAEVATSIFQKEKNTHWEIKGLELMAAIALFQHYRNQNGTSAQLAKAKEHINNAQSLYEKQPNTQKDKNLYGYLLLTNATIHYNDTTGMAFDWLLSAEKIFQKEKNELGLARVNLNKGLFAKENNQSYFEKTIAIYQQLNNASALKRTYLSYGSFCIEQSRKTQPHNTELWNKGLQLLHQGKDLLGEENICDALNQIGYAYSVQNNIDSARHYFDAAVYRSKKEYNVYCLEKFLNLKTEICKRDNNCDLVIEDINLAYAEILSNRDAIITQSITTKAEHSKRSAEKLALQKRNQILWGSLAGLLGIGFIFYFLYQRQRIQKLKSQTKAQQAELKAKNAQIQALGARMNPHFISNTLNAIDSMIYTNDKVEASKYLVKFAKLSRLVLANSESTLIPLEKEVEMLKYYLSLEKMRFEEEIEFYLEIDDSLDLMNIYIPPMLLQPFIENAIIHGIQPKDGNGKISISIHSKERNQLECIIEDDGIGRIQAKAIQQNSTVERESFSTKISEDRIQLINNMDGANLITEDLHNPIGEPNGTKITITIPKNLRPATTVVANLN